MAAKSARIPPARMAVWREFLEVHALVVGALEAELDAERDLPLAWYDVLVALSEAPDHRLRMQDLADRVLFSRSGLTRLVDRMVAAGYVERVRCDDDRRGTFAALTAAGTACLRAATGVHLRGVSAHFDDHLAESDVRALHHAFRKILDGAPGVSEPR